MSVGRQSRLKSDAPAELQLAERAAWRAGDIIAGYFRDGVVIRSKEAHDLVSDADLDAEKAIVEDLQRAYPDHAILAEEVRRDDADAEHLWVVDPLDGTNNFAHQVPHFAVSIAYYHRGVAQCGVVFNPLSSDTFWAVRGGGAYHNNRQLNVSNHRRLDQTMVGVGFYYDRGRMMEATLDAVRTLFHQQIHGIRRLGTAALDFCQVATGRYGAYFEYKLSPWDFAAGRLIVTEAGGTVTNCRGEPLPLEVSTVLASNGHLHPMMVEIVGEFQPN